MRAKTLIPILAVLLLTAKVGVAQPRSIGAEISPSRIGFLYQHIAKSGDHSAVNTISTGVDITGSILQRNPFPGFYFDYSCDFNLVQESGRDVVFSLLVGPGVEVGFGDDFKNPAGFFIGPMADVRAGITFRSTPLSLFIVTRPTLSLHVYKAEGNIRMGMYKHGLMSSVIPQLGITYRFDHDLLMDQEPWEGETKHREHPYPYPLITYGLEFGYIANFHVYSHFNYIPEGGYRVDHEDNDFGYSTNANVMAHFGFNVSENLNLSAYAGYQGINRKQRIFPVTLRATVLFGKHDDPGRWLSYIGGGIGLKGSEKMFGNAYVANCGVGYRLNLTREVKLDFLSGLVSTYWHPDTFSESIDVRRSNEILLGGCFSVSLTF